jgi:cell filamentation protein
VTDWEDYFYPGTNVLRNKLGVQDREELQRAENRLVEQRIRMGCPEGNFDLTHLQAIHRHLFQDVYEWAGELRQVDMFKNEPGEYMPHDRIEMGIHDVHRRVVKANVLGSADPWEFSAKAAEIIGDINHAHPFREGNTRTQLQYLQQLGEQAGHNIDLTKIDRDAWNEAKIQSGRGSYGYMNDQIRAAIVSTLEKTLPMEKRTWEQVVKDDESLRVKELQDQRDAQQVALKNIITGVEGRGNDPVERAEKLRDFDEKVRQQLADKLREQQERLERLELLRKGPPAGRQRE